jgi:hypothetical protein
VFDLLGKPRMLGRKLQDILSENILSWKVLTEKDEERNDKELLKIVGKNGQAILEK